MKKYLLILILLTGCATPKSVFELNKAKNESLQNYAYNVDVIVFAIASAKKQQANDHLDYVFKKTLDALTASSKFSQEEVTKAINIRDDKKKEIDQEFARDLAKLEESKKDLQNVIEFENKLNEYLNKQGVNTENIKSISDMLLKKMIEPSDGSKG